MSYCRFGEADIYVYGSMSALICSGCPTDGAYFTKSAGDMIRHMKGHRDAGLKVPDYAFLDIFWDRNEYRADAI